MAKVGVKRINERLETLEDGEGGGWGGGAEKQTSATTAAFSQSRLDDTHGLRLQLLLLLLLSLLLFFFRRCTRVFSLALHRSKDRRVYSLRETCHENSAYRLGPSRTSSSPIPVVDLPP